MSMGPVIVNARPATQGTDVKVGSFVSRRPHVLRSLDRALLMTLVIPFTSRCKSILIIFFYYYYSLLLLLLYWLSSCSIISHVISPESP